MFIFGSIYFYIDGVPSISNFVVNRLPTSVDKEVGKELRKEILRGAPVDREKTKLLNEFFAELNYDGNTKLYVVNASEFNAFALPDNSIFVLSKVLDDVKTYPQLAALLGHEYSHIKYRHSMKTLGQALSWELLAAIFSDNSSDNFVRNANKLLTLSNSRAFETQADKGGLELLEQNHIDMNGMVEMFEIMEEIPKKGNESPTYLSTHPDTEDRLQTIKDELKSKKNNFTNNSKLDLIFNELTAKHDDYRY